MAKQKLEIPGKGRLQYLVYVGLSIFVMGFVLVLYSSGGLFFQSYFGRINPLIVFLLIVILGFILFSFLLSEGSFEIYKKENLKGLVVSSGLAGLFGIIIILVDLKIVFPVDMNVPFPESILFYPVIAFLVEIIFHVFPLSMLLLFVASAFKGIKNGAMICFVIVSLSESIYQALAMDSLNQYSLWAIAYVGIHVFLFNLAQLLIFRRYDFISMYSFRLVYYIVWHIVWGYFRKQILF